MKVGDLIKPSRGGINMGMDRTNRGIIVAIEVIEDSTRTLITAQWSSGARIRAMENCFEKV